MACDGVPMTESQLGLLMVNRAVAVPHLYNIVAEIEMDPQHSAEAVADGLAAVMIVQPALRLSLSGGADRQAELLVPSPADRILSQHTVNAADLDARRRALLAELASLPLLHGEPPMLRAAHLLASDRSRSLLLMVVHHTVFDGYSLRPLVDDLNAAIIGTIDASSLRGEREAALRAELDSQVLATAEAATSQQARELADRVIAQPPTTLYPRSDRLRPAGSVAGTVRLSLSAEESSAVDALCAGLRVSPFTFFSAVFGAVLSRHSGNRSVCFGTPLTARRTTRAFDLCGFFINTLPIVLDVPWESPFAEFVSEEVSGKLIDAMSRRAVPLGMVVRHCGSRRRSMFSTLLTTEEDMEPAGSAPVLAARLRGNGTSKFDLQVCAKRTGQGWALEFEHDKDVLPRQVIAAMVGSTRGALLRVTGQPCLPLKQLFADAPRSQPTTAGEVIDITGHRAPIGVPGELAGGGPHAGARALRDELGRLVLLGDVNPLPRSEEVRPTASERPADMVETEVLELWSELLRRKIPVDQSLFECGAHSLNLLTAVERLEKRYGVSIPILDFFEKPTVRRLAAIIRAAQGDL